MQYVSVVAAVLNEGDNIEKFLYMLNETDGVNEVIIVDDGSTDSTIDKIKNFKGRFTVKLIERKRKGGTVSAQIDGARLASNEYVVVMDADLQHDPSIIPKMLSVATQGYDLVVASRLVEGGVSKRDAIRGMISRGATFLAHLFIPQTNKIRDVMSGYFLAKRDIVAGLPPVDNSYKLLLYIFAYVRGLKCVEIPYEFSPRASGESKVVSGPGFLITYMVELMHYVRVEYNSEVGRNV